MFWLIGCAAENINQPLVIESTYEVEWESIPTAVINDRGQLFTFEEMYLVLYSMRLPECSVSQYFWNPIRPVIAGHSDFAIPSNSNQSIILDLTERGQFKTTVQFAEQNICTTALTFARWDGDTNNVPNGIEDTFSVYATGQCKINDDWVSFKLATSVPSERILEVQLPNVHLQNAFYWNVHILYNNIVDQINCSELDNSSVNALQLLYNIQENSVWTQEYYDG